MNDMAGISAFLATPAVALAMLFWVQFSVTRENRFGVLNDIAVVVALILLILPAIAVGDLLADADGWFGVLSWIAIAGLVLAALGQVLLISGAISLQTSFVTGGIGIALFWRGWLPSPSSHCVTRAHPLASAGRQSCSSPLSWMSS
jgi:protein-S-isoprenylcysteine O-methyltransferase Ste14